MEYLNAVEKEAVDELKEALQKMLGDRLVGLKVRGMPGRPGCIRGFSRSRSH